VLNKCTTRKAGSQGGGNAGKQEIRIVGRREKEEMMKYEG
jgi:hypothetical protein